MRHFDVSAAPVDLAQWREALQHPGSGGFCAFEGWVRDSNEGRAVSGLEYEAYTELAIAEGERILAEAAERYGVLAASAVHRVGNLKIGDLAVWIGVSAPHRDEAFRACRYIIDEIKHRLPIWKKEHYLEGDTAWVACSHTERAHEHEPPHAHHHPHDPVVPANAGTQRLDAATESLDPSFRWGDEQKSSVPHEGNNAGGAHFHTGRAHEHKPPHTHRHPQTPVVPANAGTQRLDAATESLDPSVRWGDEQESAVPFEDGTARSSIHGVQEHEPLHTHRHPQTPVVPANAGTQRFDAATESLDPSVRWGDEQESVAPFEDGTARSPTHGAHEHEPPHTHRHSQTPVVPANAGTQRLDAATESPAPSPRWSDEQEHFTPDYSRQTRLREVGDTGQHKLTAARVLVIGAGGLGVPVISYLAGAGVGTLGIVDGDVLDASNLHRQVMYDARDVGQRKVDLAARRVAALNPSVQVITYAQPLHAGNIADVFAGYDLVVECTDDLASRYLANDAAVLTSTPLVLASVYQYEGQLQVVTAVPGEPCLRCLWPEPPAPGLAGSCVESGVLGPVPGVLGTLQAMEALKLLLGLPRPADHALQLVNLLDGTTQRLPIDAQQGCARHGGCVAVARRALEQAQADEDIGRTFAHLDQAIAEGFAVIDVREPEEIAAAPLHVTSLRIPSGDIDACPLDHLDSRVLLVCASGKRSTHAARSLRRRGVDAWSLAGGVAALAHPVAS